MKNHPLPLSNKPIFFFSWLRSLNAIRNICAHHSRLWNRVLGDTPKLPSEHKHPVWHIHALDSNKKVFIILTILHYMLSRVAPTSGWDKRLRKLLQDNPYMLAGMV